MDVTAEIDKAGRLVVPKKMREALHLVPGTRLTFHQEGEIITIQQESKSRGLFRKDGILVYDAGPQPLMDAADLTEKDRETRVMDILGDWSKL